MSREKDPWFWQVIQILWIRWRSNLRLKTKQIVEKRSRKLRNYNFQIDIILNFFHDYIKSANVYTWSLYWYLFRVFLASFGFWKTKNTVYLFTIYFNFFSFDVSFNLHGWFSKITYIFNFKNMLIQTSSATSIRISSKSSSSKNPLANFRA